MENVLNDTVRHRTFDVRRYLHRRVRRSRAQASEAECIGCCLLLRGTRMKPTASLRSASYAPIKASTGFVGSAASKHGCCGSQSISRKIMLATAGLVFGNSYWVSPPMTMQQSNLEFPCPGPDAGESAARPRRGASGLGGRAISFPAAAHDICFAVRGRVGAERNRRDSRIADG